MQIIPTPQAPGCAIWVFANNDVQTLLPAGMIVQRVKVRTEPSTVQGKADIIAGFNQGRALVNYSGHGNVDVWTGASIFTSNDALALTNGNKAFFRRRDGLPQWLLPGFYVAITL